MDECEGSMQMIAEGVDGGGIMMRETLRKGDGRPCGVQACVCVRVPARVWLKVARLG